MPRLIAALAFALPLVGQAPPDPRHLLNGRIIPDEGYSDQPYIVKTGDGAWLCAITTGPGVEGAGGQHVVTRRSTDQGRTWSEAVDVEPRNGPEASYAVLLKVPSGRIYVFYNHNTDNVRKVIADNPPYKDGYCTRVDSLGHFVFKYSDDHGRTWSSRRYDVPMRDFEIDRKNAYQGKLKFFWNVGKAFVHQGAGYVPIHKVGGFGEGFFTSSEGALLRSPNILTERDPEKIRWETLPDGDKGLRTPQGGGPIAEEQSFSILSDGSLFCVYRTIDGHPVFTYSRDAGRTWDEPQYMGYADGRLMKHPRAANFAWRCEDGKFLYWFHNHGGRFIREHPRRPVIAYDDRNPVWLVGGVEVDSPKGKVVRWSHPELALYDDDPYVRMSYPDLVEDGGRYFFTETQKDIARVHEIQPAFLRSLWSEAKPVEKPLLDVAAPFPPTVELPPLPEFLRRSHRADYGTEDLRAGLTIVLEREKAEAEPGGLLLDNRTPEGRGFAVVTAADGAVELVLNDGRAESRWRSDPHAGAKIAAIVDGGPKIISFVTDGRFCDGGEYRQFGWGRFNPNLRSVNGENVLRIGRRVTSVRIFGKALRVGEAAAITRR